MVTDIKLRVGNSDQYSRKYSTIYRQYIENKQKEQKNMDSTHVNAIYDE